MFYAQSDRDAMLSWLPKGGAVAEIGVFRGDFSRQILETVKPVSLDLIDVWRWTYYDWNKPPDSELANIEHFKAWARSLDPLYDGGHPDTMLERFYNDLMTLSSKDKRVKVHRGLTVEVAKEIPDARFDTIYVDADHHYGAVLADFFAYAPKLKRGGLILCDDFLEDLKRKDDLYGVVDAANTFCKRTGFRPLVVVGPSACQAVLYKDWSPYVAEFHGKLLASGVPVIELNDAVISRFAQKTVDTTFGPRSVASFA